MVWYYFKNSFHPADPLVSTDHLQKVSDPEYKESHNFIIRSKMTTFTSAKHLNSHFTKVDMIVQETQKEISVSVAVKEM